MWSGCIGGEGANAVAHSCLLVVCEAAVGVGTKLVQSGTSHHSVFVCVQSQGVGSSAPHMGGWGLCIDMLSIQSREAMLSSTRMHHDDKAACSWPGLNL